MPKDIIVCVDCEGEYEQIKRIWDVIQKREIKVNFFFVGETVKNNKSLVKEISTYHNVDSHTLSHHNLRKLTKEQQRSEILKGKEIVEEAIGRVTYGFRAPYYFINQHTVEILNEEKFVYDLSGLYFRYNMKNVIEIRPSWFREWTNLYEWIGLSPHTAWGIYKILFRLFNPFVMPVHPHYSGKDDKFVKAMEDFFIFAKEHSARFLHIPEYLNEKELWKAK